MKRQDGSGGVGFAGLLFIVFLVLKLTSTIDWPWWWVTAPLWGPFLLGIALFMLVQAKPHWFISRRR